MMNHEIERGSGGADGPILTTKNTKMDRRIGPDGLTGGPVPFVYFVYFVVESGGRTVPFHAFGGE